MWRRSLAVLAAIVLAFASAGSVPAAAAHAVTITFPPPVADYYSPFGGPATITIAVDPGDTDEIFTARLRPSGGAVIASTSIAVLNEDVDGLVTKSFTWPALSVPTLTQYDVTVSRDGAPVATESFFLRPRLVRLTGVAPNPFFPWIDDGYKDTTTVTFDLEAPADAAAHVFRPRSNGKCCGSRVLIEDIGSLDAGTNVWDWDGRDQGGSNLAAGDHFVKIRADDGTRTPATSRPWKVTIRRSYRATATRSKLARAYHHVGSSSSIVLGGGCLIYVSGGNLHVLCQGGKISVSWRWALDDDERIVSQRFGLESSTQDCPRSIRSTAHTKHGSSFTVAEDLPGSRALCTLSTAKITYSYPVRS